MNDTFCTELALNDNAPLAGTATRGDVWICLEYNGLWTSDAIAENNLPDEVNQWLHTQQQVVENSRVLFIKQTRFVQTTTLYIASTIPNQERMYKFELDSVTDLMAIDLPAVLDQFHEDARSEESIFLICTNGKRDKCCSKFGIPVAQRMQLLVEENGYEGLSVWESSHQGGHRYSCVAMQLPQGHNYGYIEPKHADELLELAVNNEISVPHYRGHIGRSPWENAAACYLLEAGFSGYALQSLEIQDDLGTAVFSASENDLLTVTVRQLPPQDVVIGCNQMKWDKVRPFELVGIE